jgi:8-oxo-dGTP pyrophosphatase MutT (NUDIX family)
LERSELVEALRKYKTSFADENIFVKKFLQLLEHPRAYYRDHLPGHMTGSAWIVDETRSYVLLTHHAKLNRWLQPGGHADGDENIHRVALTEAMEETGLTNFDLLSKGIFDIDIHIIPARGEFPQHDHYDVRICMEANMRTPLTLTRESQALEWVPINELAARTMNNQSMLRMAEKIKRLLTT